MAILVVKQLPTIVFRIVGRRRRTESVGWRNGWERWRGALQWRLVCRELLSVLRSVRLILDGCERLHRQRHARVAAFSAVLHRHMLDVLRATFLLVAVCLLGFGRLILESFGRSILASLPQC